MSDYVIPEVVSEILKRLPVKSLLRFRCVCRDWYSLISSPKFISQHLSHSSSSLSKPTLVRRYSKLHSKEIYTLYHHETFDTKNSYRMNFPFHERAAKFYFRIVGVCNGLLCLSDDMFAYNETIIVWNPSIKRALNFPTPRVVYKRYGPYTCAIGFGFDSKTDDYKVVRVAYLSPDDSERGHVIPPKVEVFSLSLGVWRRVKNNVESYVTEHFWSQAVFRGFVHWVAYRLICDDESDKLFRNLVLRFDLHTEKFVEMCLPEELANRVPITILATLLKGHLAILYHDDFVIPNSRVNNYSIWVMKEYGNVDSWANVFSVELDTGLTRMLGVKKNNELLFSGKNGEMVSFDLENGIVTGTGIFSTKDSFFVAKYAESLVLLGKGTKAEKTEPDYEDEDERVEQAEYRNKVLSFGLITSIIKRF